MKEKLIAHLGKHEGKYLLAGIALGLVFLGWVIS